MPSWFLQVVEATNQQHACALYRAWCAHMCVYASPEALRDAISPGLFALQVYHLREAIA